MEEDEAPITVDHEMQDEESGWTEVKETMMDEASDKEDEKEEVLPDETIHESAVGKGLAATLRLLKDRGALKETIEWGGRNMDKKKSKLVGINDEDGKKEIRIERTDEYGRIVSVLFIVSACLLGLNLFFYHVSVMFLIRTTSQPFVFHAK